MKLLVFAHTPPPHHGQSYMVKLMLDGFGGDCRHRKRADSGGFDLNCYHVNARLSRDMEDIGSMRPQKFLILFWHCLSAIWCRFRYGIRVLYYIPAPGKQSAIWRDWLVMKLCRPFFDHLVLHWHAAGMARWLQTSVQMRTRKITYRTLGRASLSIVLSNYGRSDAEKLLPARVAVVGNGIPDPCPQFDADVLPRRRARAALRRQLLEGQPVSKELLPAAGPDPHIFKLLFMAHCTREKGLFEALEGAIRAQNQLAASQSAICIKLQIAGQFMDRDEEKEFRKICETTGANIVEPVGFVSGDLKHQLLAEADLFCFPSHLESFGLVLAEAMAYGLPIITTRCGALPEVMSADYPGLVELKSPDQIEEAILRMLPDGPFEGLRQRFQTHFTVDRHLENLAASLRSMEGAEPERTPHRCSTSST